MRHSLAVLLLVIASCLSACAKTKGDDARGERAVESTSRTYRADPTFFDAIGKAYEYQRGRTTDGGVPLVYSVLTPRSQRPRARVFILGGGPFSATYEERGLRNALALYDGFEAELVFVEYSGSRCCGDEFILRLREGGLPVLGEDAASLTRLIEDLDDGTPVIVQTSSFSTPVGLLTLDGLDGPECVAGVFIAPWTHFFPTEWVYAPERNIVPDFDRTIEQRKADWRHVNEAYFHINEDAEDDASRQWMRRVAQDAANIPHPVFALIPPYENRMDPDVGVAYFESFPAATVHVPTWGFHESAGSSPKDRAALRAFLADTLKPGACSSQR